MLSHVRLQAMISYKLFLSILRGTLVCIWEEFLLKGPPAPPYPPAPQVLPTYSVLLVDGISSNLAHIFSSPEKFVGTQCTHVVFITNNSQIIQNSLINGNTKHSCSVHHK